MKPTPNINRHTEALGRINAIIAALDLRGDMPNELEQARDVRKFLQPAQADHPHPHAASIRRLRERADLIEQHPDLSWLSDGDRTLLVYCHTKESLAAAARAIGGKWEKDADDQHFNMRQNRGGFGLMLYTARSNVCRRVEREVTKPAEPEQVIPAKPERVEKVVEWVCDGPVLAAIGGAA